MNICIMFSTAIIVIINYSQCVHLSWMCMIFDNFKRWLLTKRINIEPSTKSDQQSNTFVKPWWLESGSSWPGLRNWELGIRNWEVDATSTSASARISTLCATEHCTAGRSLASLLINFCSRRSPPILAPTHSYHPSISTLLIKSESQGFSGGPLRIFVIQHKWMYTQSETFCNVYPNERRQCTVFLVNYFKKPS